MGSGGAGGVSSRRILILGGYGLIGSYVMARLHGEGYQLRGLGRSVRQARLRFAYADWVAADLAQMQRPEDWARPLEGVDAVVNCAGALQDSPRDDLRAVHVRASAALYAACAARGVRRVIHISAAGVAAGRGTVFNDTKLEADTALQAQELDWVILRPGLMLAPSAYGGTALLRGLAAFPFAIPVAHAEALVQVVSAQDVAEAVARALAGGAPAKLTLDLVADEASTLGEILLALRAWLGLAPAPLVGVPAGLATRLADAIALLGWRSPMRSTAMAQLSAGVVGQSEPALTALDLRPRRLSEILAAWPSGVQERWFARLYFLKPLALFGLIAFWMTSGLVGVTGGFAHAVATLTQVGIPDGAGRLIVIGGAVIDIALALAACFHRSASWALKGMVLVCAGYLAGGSLLRPDLWLDPLGPFVKIIPAALLALVTLAVMDER